MRTALYNAHVSLKAKIVDFAGWEMPLQYEGIVAESDAVRKNAGLFDVSHMGRIVVSGKGAAGFLDYLSTNAIQGKKDFTATYTLLPNEQGGTVDDVLVYKINSNNFFLIVNAGNREKDLAHLKLYGKGFDVEIKDRFSGEGILALQGPKGLKIATEVFPEVKNLAPMHFLFASFLGEEVIVAGTGYTGAGGVEIIARDETIILLWEKLLEVGKKEGIKPAGLGSRDLLRLEKGYALYGHELSEEIKASESVSFWTIKREGRDFLGKMGMLEVERNPQKRSQHGIVLDEQGVARAGHEIVKEGKEIGKVTSGGYSPTLKKSIAIAMVTGSLQAGEEVVVKIRETKVKAHVVKLPFF